MKARRLDARDRFVNILRNRIRIKINKPSAIGISVLLHFTVGIAIASLYVGEPMPERASEPALEFELVSIPELETEQIMIENELADRLQNTHSPQVTGKAIGSVNSTSDVLVAENTAVSKKAIMMASLSTLSDLRESFRFMVQEISADSSGVFTPLQGNAPNTSIFSNGANGYGVGGRTGIISIGGGSGACPPGGGGIYQ